MRDIISSGLADMGLLDRVPPQAPEQLAAYGRLLLEKNQVMNLTAIRDEEGVARLHMLDCAGLLCCADLWGEGKTLIDVGSGAGFPGLALKILVPSLRVTLLDSLGKRVDWLNETAARLGLTGVEAIHARAEEQGRTAGFRDGYDFAAARAVADLRVLCELCLPFVRPGGLFLAMKAVDCQGEVEGAARAVRALGGRMRGHGDYPIPGTQVVRRAVLVEKTAPTPGAYPRRWAKIQKEPI